MHTYLFIIILSKVLSVNVGLWCIWGDVQCSISDLSWETWGWQLWVALFNIIRLSGFLHTVLKIKYTSLAHILHFSTALTYLSLLISHTQTWEPSKYCERSTANLWGWLAIIVSCAIQWHVFKGTEAYLAFLAVTLLGLRLASIRVSAFITIICHVCGGVICYSPCAHTGSLQDKSRREWGIPIRAVRFMVH